MKRIIAVALSVFIVSFASPLWSQNKGKGGAKKVAVNQAEKFMKTPDGKLMKMLVEEYTSASKQNAEVTSALSKLMDLQRRLNISDKAEFHNIINKNYWDARAESNSQSLKAAASLYKFFAAEDDAILPDVLFCLGEMAAYEPFDSTEIKNSIHDLYAYQQVTNQSQQEKITKLEEYLDAIRSMVPLTQDLDGIWVSNVFDTQMGVPFFILKISNGGENVMISKLSSYVRTRFIKAKSEYAQDKRDLGSNTAYYLFSTEDMKSIDPSIQAFVHEQASNVNYQLSSSLAAEMGGDVGGQLVSGMVGGLIQAGSSALLDRLMAPMKRIYISHFWLHKVNPNQLVAECKTRYVAIVGDDKPRIDDHEYINMKFMRWTPESGVSFATYNDFGFQLLDLTQEEVPSQGEMRKMKKDPEWRYRGDYLLLDKTRNFTTYNYMMIRNLMYRAEQGAINNGWPVFHEDEKYDRIAYLGASFKSLDDVPNHQNVEGVYIDSVTPATPAQLFGLHKGDIITSIDDYPMTHPQEVVDYIKNVTPFSSLKITVIHKGKQKTIPVTVSFEYVPK